ncbi:hypothetical protein BD560DRAFT_396960 [Blakeslea trispora]|nr:hypothetical protein BD560DRAFT_396960 [Blakeslea trispora]
MSAIDSKLEKRKNSREESLLKWISQQSSITITEAHQLTDPTLLATIIEALFDVRINKQQEDIQDVISQIPNTGQAQFIYSDDLPALLDYIQTSYELHFVTYTILNNTQLTFTSFFHEFIPITNRQEKIDIRNYLLSWASFILADYINASILPPILDLPTMSSNGIYLLSLLHYHQPALIPDLHLYLHEPQALDIAIKLTWEIYHIPSSLFTQDTAYIYLLQLVASLQVPNSEQTVQRHKDIERFKNLIKITNDASTTPTPILTDNVDCPPSPSNDNNEDDHSEKQEDSEKDDKRNSTTFTSTFTVQQLKITKTTVTKYSDGTEVPTELEEFETRASTLTEKMNGLQHRLVMIIPTRATATSPSSANSESIMDFFSTDDNTTASSLRDSSSHYSLASNEDLTQLPSLQQQLIRVLHPLQAAEEDYATYDRNFKALQSEFQTLTDGDFNLLLHVYLIEQLEPVWQEHPKVVWRKQQLSQLHHSLSSEFEHSELTLASFRRGFAFARMCQSIRHELELVQNKMVKSISTHHDIQDLELRVEKTTDMVKTLKNNFNDLLLVSDSNTSKEGGTMIVASESSPDTQNSVADTAYLTKYEAVVNKNQLVKSWVEEVRVWFSEAERIRQWMEIRMDQLDKIVIPSSLLSPEKPPITREVLQSLISQHSALEKEIEMFNRQDMERLRSHVKTLTGADRQDNSKDLSPADTTTIGITLTTLNMLDKMMNSLRKKSLDLLTLTKRLDWEEEYVKSMVWLKDTDEETDKFLHEVARWRPSELDQSDEMAQLDEYSMREWLLNKEKQKSLVTEQLYRLERERVAFDKNQFTKTINAFLDLSNQGMELPDQFETRQSACEHQFENLIQRIGFARQVVEQRLSVMDFLHQTGTVMEEGRILQLELTEAEGKVRPTDTDQEMTVRVDAMEKKLAHLLTVTSRAVAFPVPTLDEDKEDNEAANQEINQVITEKCNQLLSLRDALYERLNSYRFILQLHRQAKNCLEDADRLCEWAEERTKAMKRAKAEMQEGLGTIFTAEDLQRLERDRANVQSKLENDKEKQVIDLVLDIQTLLDTSKSLDIPSFDRDSLVEVSQHIQERFDCLQLLLKEHVSDLEAMRQKMKDGNAYFENARSLRSFINETRHSMPGLKQTCGFMTGQSEEQDKRRFEMLNQAQAKINQGYKEQEAKFAQLCSHYAVMEPTRIENMDEIRAVQTNLQQDWNQLSNEVRDLNQFTEVVGEWYNRQRRLSMVENNLMAGLNDEITHLARSGWENETELAGVHAKINQASAVLDEIGQAIRAADNKEDPLQTANYSCARDRLSQLTNQVLTASRNLKALKSDANKAVALGTFLSETDKILSEIQRQKELVMRRMSAVGSSGFVSQDKASIDAMFKSIQSATAYSEKGAQSFAKQLSILNKKATELAQEGYDASSVQDPIKRIHENLNQLSNTIGIEKKQAMFVQKVFLHAKAVVDLKQWMDHCTHAIHQLPTDVCMHDEQELQAQLDTIKKNMADATPSFKGFQTLRSRILTAKDGAPLDLCEISIDPNETNSILREHEQAILKDWEAVKQQYEDASRLIEESKKNVEIARKFKAVLNQVGDMKDRVSAVRICKDSAEEDMTNRDLTAILSCPLSSIPGEHRLASAKAELDILDRDIDAHLIPSIQELDNMLSLLKHENGQDMFSDQRAEITIAMEGLTRLMKTKRRAIAEAEKMEGFLTVVEELEVLLLAVGEVVARAAPENARIVDGSYSRTDLQALLIDLDTRYRYYEPKIHELFDEARMVSLRLLDDPRVEECISQLEKRWEKLQAEVAAKKEDLMARIGPLSDTFDSLEIADSLLPQEKGARKAASLMKRKSNPILRHPSPQASPSTRIGGAATSKAAKRHTTTPVPFAFSNTGARANARKVTTSPTIKRLSGSGRLSQRSLRSKTPETYVADPQNDLDVAVGDIVNDSPYKIFVKMVPGEVGKYWFGEVNPKLAYCRILRSRMVMVRVGGGWVELSQFLRDHALLEGGNFVSGRHSRASMLPTPSGVTRDGFLNTASGRITPHNNRMTVNNHGVVSIRGGAAANGSHTPLPTMRASKSTPYRGISQVPYTHGIKAGNKFLVALDGEGNRVEVKMTKATDKDTKFTTPRRLNI